MREQNVTLYCEEKYKQHHQDQEETNYLGNTKFLRICHADFFTPLRITYPLYYFPLSQ